MAASSSGSWVCTSDWAARVFQSRRGEAGPCHRKALCRCLLLPGGCTSAGLGSERRLQTPPIGLPLLSLVGFFLYCFKCQMFCALGRLYFFIILSPFFVVVHLWEDLLDNAGHFAIAVLMLTGPRWCSQPVGHSVARRDRGQLQQVTGAFVIQRDCPAVMKHPSCPIRLPICCLVHFPRQEGLMLS